MRTGELTGALLDYWVARAEGVDVVFWHNEGPEDQAQVVRRFSKGEFPNFYPPSSNWMLGGLLIGEHRMYVEYDADGYWVAHTDTGATVRGDTPLTSVCRAVVQSKFGDEVPDA